MASTALSATVSLIPRNEDRGGLVSATAGPPEEDVGPVSVGTAPAVAAVPDGRAEATVRCPRGKIARDAAPEAIGTVGRLAIAVGLPSDPPPVVPPDAPGRADVDLGASEGPEVPGGGADVALDGDCVGGGVTPGLWLVSGKVTGWLAGCDTGEMLGAAVAVGRRCRVNVRSLTGGVDQLDTVGTAVGDGVSEGVGEHAGVYRLGCHRGWLLTGRRTRGWRWRVA
jgi:hypothetical protein